MIEFKNSFIQAIDMIEPDLFVSSDDIENQLSKVYDRLKLPYGRIHLQSGIEKRGVYTNKLPSEIATFAGKNIFENNQIKPEEIDLLIYCGVCRDYLEPSTASSIHYRLGLRDDCLSFDLSNACLGMVNGMQLASSWIESGKINKVLLVTGENSKPLLDSTIEKLKNDESISRKEIKKYVANFTIGSAGVAMVIGKDCGLAKIESTQHLSNTSTYKLCQGGGNTDELAMETDSEMLMAEGIKLAKENWKGYLGRDFDHYICHQVGIHHRDYLYRNLELDLSKDTSTFPSYGNTGSAALPLTLFKAQRKFKSGEKIALLGIGSGLHTLSSELTWI